MTARFLLRDQVPFRFVVEPQEADLYRARYPEVELLVLPFRDQGSVIPARNWIREHSIAEGHDRHWQLDDNINDIRRFYRGLQISCHAGTALRVCEDFTDRYTNIGVSGLNYEMFVTEQTRSPVYVNCHVYSCSLIWNRMPYHWRGRYNEDTDLCLQVLAAGLCTAALNVFVAHKQQTMISRGGNTDALDYHNDGRLRMARALQRQWPRVVQTRRRFNRPQHVIRGSWAGFDTPLQRRADIDWSALADVDEYGLELIRLGEIQSPRIRRIYEEARSGFVPGVRSLPVNDPETSPESPVSDPEPVDEPENPVEPERPADDDSDPSG